MPILAVILWKLLTIFATHYPRSIVHIEGQIISKFTPRHIMLVWSSLGVIVSTTNPLTCSISRTLRWVMWQGFRGWRRFYWRTFRSGLPSIKSASPHPQSFLVILWQERYFVFLVGCFTVSRMLLLWLRLLYLDLLLRRVLGWRSCVWFGRGGHKVRIAVVHHNVLVESYLVRCKNLTFAENSLVLGHWSWSWLLKSVRPLPDISFIIMLHLVYTQLMLVILSFSNSIVRVGPTIDDLLTLHITTLVILWFYTVSI